MDYLIEESGEHRKFGYLPEMRSMFPCQRGALTYERFSELTISVANVIVGAHYIRLEHENLMI